MEVIDFVDADALDIELTLTLYLSPLSSLPLIRNYFPFDRNPFHLIIQ
jgi:hypothetical protein